MLKYTSLILCDYVPVYALQYNTILHDSISTESQIAILTIYTDTSRYWSTHWANPCHISNTSKQTNTHTRCVCEYKNHSIVYQSEHSNSSIQLHWGDFKATNFTSTYYTLLSAVTTVFVASAKSWEMPISFWIIFCMHRAATSPNCEFSMFQTYSYAPRGYCNVEVQLL